MEKFAIGVVLGMVGGALLTANNYKMRTLVKKGQEEVQAKLDELMDEKLKEFETDEKTAAPESAEEKTAKKPAAKKAAAK